MSHPVRLKDHNLISGVKETFVSERPPRGLTYLGADIYIWL
jgi:hypothetical protein